MNARRANQRRSHRTASAGCRVEPLEQRTLCAVIGGVWVAGGTLNIMGSSSADTIWFKETSSGVEVYRNGAAHSFSFSSTPITDVYASLGDGNDSFRQLVVYVAGYRPVIDMYVSGGSGNDTIETREGNDIVYCGSGDDQVRAGEGVDVIWGEGDDDVLDGEGDGDFLYGGSGDDELNGAGGSDWIEGGAGCDELYGGDAVDALDGGSGNDLLLGEDGDDHMDGGADDDVLWGGDGTDRLNGGDDDDRLCGDSIAYGDEDGCEDVLTGGSGSDVFLSRFSGWSLQDDIVDFVAGDDALACFW